jgi:hypothetical protein
MDERSVASMVFQLENGLGEPMAEKMVLKSVEQSEPRKAVHSVGYWVDPMVVELVVQLVSSKGMNSVGRSVLTREQKTVLWTVVR